MKDYTTDAPVFSDRISIVEHNDLINDENNNAAAIQLLQNILVLQRTKVDKEEGKGLVSNAEKALWNGIYEQSTGYTDQKIADLINGAPSTLDTLKEIADAMSENENVVEALEAAMGTKANQAEVESWLGTKLDKTGDSGSTTVNYTSDDTTTPSGWQNFALFTGFEKLKEFAVKVSTMASNLRWLYKMLGTTDISAIGDGTVTGALDVLNSNIADIITGNFSGMKSGDSIKLPRAVRVDSFGIIFPMYNNISTVQCIFVSQSVQAGIDILNVVAYDTKTQSISTSTTLAGRYVVLPNNFF